MSIENQSQLQNTRAKLQLLEEAVLELKRKPGSNAYVDELSLRSLQDQIKQLKEERRNRALSHAGGNKRGK